MITTQLAEVPSRRNLLPDELVVSVGCVGCTGVGCGDTKISRTDKAQRMALREDLKTAQGMTGVPVTVTSAAFVETYTTPEKQTICNQNICAGDVNRIYQDILEGEG